MNEHRPPRVPQTAEEAASATLSMRPNPEGFVNLLGIIDSGVENGTIRTEITCSEHVGQFFEMARRFFVDNGEAKMSDAESGIHEGACESPICGKLAETYWTYLRYSKPEDSAAVAIQLDDLERNLLLGDPIEEVVGQRSGIYDSDTGISLPIVSAVDITRLCRIQDGETVRLLYTQPLRGTLVDLQINGTRVLYPVGDEEGLMDPKDEVFAGRAEIAGIDPVLLKGAIVANAPQKPPKNL